MSEIGFETHADSLSGMSQVPFAPRTHPLAHALLERSGTPCDRRGIQAIDFLKGLQRARFCQPNLGACAHLWLAIVCESVGACRRRAGLLLDQFVR